MTLEWLKTGIGPLKDMITYLNKEGKTTDVLKKQLLRELRNNLNIFHNAYPNKVSSLNPFDHEVQMLFRFASRCQDCLSLALIGLPDGK